jgi:hypothetical protein
VRRMITSTVALVVCLFAVLARAQTPSAVSAAEAEGSKYSKPDMSARMALLYGEAFGPTDRRCVDAEKHATARSWDFRRRPIR